jgi:hypothetical protein
MWTDAPGNSHSVYVNGFIPAPIAVDGGRAWAVLLNFQHGVVDRNQALQSGFSRWQIEHRLESGAWQRIYPGVYATFSGVMSREARLWAAVLRAGPGAMLSHETAAELHGIIDEPMGSSIHLTVPVTRRPAQHRPARGIVIHRSGQSQQHFLGPFNLPRTRIEDTVLDLVAASPTFDRAYGWIARAVSRKLVTVGMLRAAVTSRRRIRWRDWLNDALEDVRDGAYSSLERRYIRDVERAHKLPRSQHQAGRQAGRSTTGITGTPATGWRWRSTALLTTRTSAFSWTRTGTMPTSRSTMSRRTGSAPWPSPNAPARPPHWSPLPYAATAGKALSAHAAGPSAASVRPPLRNRDDGGSLGGPGAS